MKNVTLLNVTIEKIIILLTSVEENNWLTSFNQFKQKCNNSDSKNIEYLHNEILKIYGGMGSFNDLVLYNNGQPLVKENQNLEQLRKELFDILHNNSTSNK